MPTLKEFPLHFGLLYNGGWGSKNYDDAPARWSKQFGDECIRLGTLS